MNKLKRLLFRKIINVADLIDVWFRSKFNVNLKQKALEVSQDNTPLSRLDDTIGKALNIKGVE